MCEDMPQIYGPLINARSVDCKALFDTAKVVFVQLLRTLLGGPWGFLPIIFDPKHEHIHFNLLPYHFRYQETPK